MNETHQGQMIDCVFLAKGDGRTREYLVHCIV
jgi:hypothetical protein